MVDRYNSNNWCDTMNESVQYLRCWTVVWLCDTRWRDQDICINYQSYVRGCHQWPGREGDWLSPSATQCSCTRLVLGGGINSTLFSLSLVTLLMLLLLFSFLLLPAPMFFLQQVNINTCSCKTFNLWQTEQIQGIGNIDCPHPCFTFLFMWI